MGNTHLLGKWGWGLKLLVLFMFLFPFILVGLVFLLDGG